MSKDRKIGSNEIPFELDLSVEVWFAYGKSQKDLSIAVLEGGVNDIVTRHFTWDELYEDLDYVEPIESLRESAELDVLNHKKAILKRMKEFVKERGISWGKSNGGTEVSPRMKKSQMLKIINGALKSCIDAHGEITHKNRNSAAKRIIGQFAALRDDEIS